MQVIPGLHHGDVCRHILESLGKIGVAPKLDRENDDLDVRYSLFLRYRSCADVTSKFGEGLRALGTRDIDFMVLRGELASEGRSDIACTLGIDETEVEKVMLVELSENRWRATGARPVVRASS